MTYNDDFETCYICLENIDNYIFNDNKFLVCGCFNRFHSNCIEIWYSLHNNCPIYKKKIMNEEETNKNEFLEIDDDNDIFYPIFIYIIVYLGILLYFIYLLCGNVFDSIIVVLNVAPWSMAVIAFVVVTNR